MDDLSGAAELAIPSTAWSVKNEGGVILTLSVAKGKDLLFSCTLSNYSGR
jgi:hypothetical protein